MNAILQQLQHSAGIHFMGQPHADLQVKNAAKAVRMAMDGALACDAQPALVTVSNSGIPAFLSTYFDPKLIEVLVAPMKAAEVIGAEVKKGDWTSSTLTFNMVESTGEVSSYGDFNENGHAGVNSNFPQRQPYHYQVMAEWGERELELAGLAKVDYANRISIASALALNKFQNKTYFFGVAGLQNYGLLNDPNLVASISPATKVAGGTTWPNATALEVLDDVSLLFKQLQSQANGLVDLDSAMTLAMSPTSEVALTKTTQYNVNVQDLLKKNYPNLKVVTAPEYATTAGQLLQLKLDSYEGQLTAEAVFTEKMRAHPIVVGASSFKQKRSQGTSGCVVYRPMFIASMLGV